MNRHSRHVYIYIWELGCSDLELNNPKQKEYKSHSRLAYSRKEVPQKVSMNRYRGYVYISFGTLQYKVQ